MKASVLIDQEGNMQSSVFHVDIRATLLLFLTLGSLNVWVSGEKADIKLLTSTVTGSTGFLTLPVAETLRRGEWIFGLNAHRFHRNPGALTWTAFPASFTVGLHDRIEWFSSLEAYKRMAARDVVVFKVPEGGALLPATVASAGAVGYINEAPFVDVPFGDGFGELWSGAKLNLLSERRDACFSLAVRPVTRFHLSNSRRYKLKGLTSGTPDVGFDVIASKVLGAKFALTGQAGFFSGRDVGRVVRQNEWRWGIGMGWYLFKPSVRILGELTGRQFTGEKKFDLVNAVPPLDVRAGSRIRALPWLTTSIAFEVNLRSLSDSDRNLVPSKRFGWLFQVSFERKKNRPPRVECWADKEKVGEGDIVVIRAKPSDPDDDILWLSWKSSGGHLSPQNSSVLLDTTGLEKGRYLVVGEVGDDASVASCSVDIEVVPEN